MINRKNKLLLTTVGLVAFGITLIITKSFSSSPKKEKDVVPPSNEKKIDDTVSSPQLTNINNTPTFWIHKYKNSKDVVLNLDEIKGINKKVYSSPEKFGVYNMENYSQPSKEKIKALIEKYDVSFSNLVGDNGEPYIIHSHDFHTGTSGCEVAPASMYDYKSYISTLTLK